MYGRCKDETQAKRLVGLLEMLDREKVQAVLAEHGTGRHCKRIDNVQLLWVIVGLGLFAGKSYCNLYRMIAVTDFLPPGIRATICTARKRLPAAVLQCLYERVTELLATPKKCPTAFYKGLRLMGIDGTLLDCYDSDANRRYFHRPTNQIGPGAFPKLRMVTLCELGTRVLWRSVIGTYRDSERTLAKELLHHLNSKHLLLADRLYGVASFMGPLIKNRTPFLIRVKKSHVFPIEKQLFDGSYCSRIYLGKNDRMCRRPGLQVRVIRYKLDDPARCGHDEDHLLLTTLMCPKQYPAKELICLYHQRWEEEIAFGEMKQTLHRGRVLRSHSPEMTKQEVWGLLLAHWVIRKMVYRAATEDGIETSRISFTATINIIHLQLEKSPLKKRPRHRWLRITVRQIAAEVLPERQNRTNARVIKKRRSPRPGKRDHHRKPPPPHKSFKETIRIPI